MVIENAPTVTETVTSTYQTSSGETGFCLYLWTARTIFTKSVINMLAIVREERCTGHRRVQVLR